MKQKIREEARAQISDPDFFMPSVIKLLPTAFRDQVHVNAVIGIYNQTHSRTISMNEETLICVEPGYLATEGTQIGSLNPNEPSLSQCFVMLKHVGEHNFYYVRGYRETLQSARGDAVDPFTYKKMDSRFISDVENAQRGGKLLPVVYAEGTGDLMMYAEEMTIEDNWPVFRGNPLTVRKLTLFGMTRLDNSIGMMKNLTRLYCGNNQLITLPPELGNLTALEWFYCSNNQLTSLPSELGRLTNLSEFDCSHNKLTSLPEEMENLRTLKILNIFDTNITAVPHGLLLLPVLNVNLNNILKDRYGSWEAMKHQLGHAQSRLSSTTRGMIIF